MKLTEDDWIADKFVNGCIVLEWFEWFEWSH
jgi:hypothetical protein